MALSLTGALGWLGRRGTGAVALSAFAGMVLPGLSSLARPLSPRPFLRCWCWPS
ncbi:hypothetical protein V6L77_02870 [Pannonibacter sp. Pt2-lr]